MLGKVVSESQRDWDSYVGQVMAAYRATVHRSTGYSPNFLVYGRENRAPIDLVLAVGEEPEGIGASPNDYVNDLLQRQRRAYELVREHLGRAAERRKREYDLRVRPKTFHKGDWVFHYYPRRYKGRSPKWARTYAGPYLIVREIPPCNFALQKSARSKPFITHTDKLKMWQGEKPPSWLPDTPPSSEDEGYPESPSEEGSDASRADTPVEMAPDSVDEGGVGVPANRDVLRKESSPGPAQNTPPPVAQTPRAEPGRVLRERRDLKIPRRYRDDTP
jgi:hypothetical protein